MDARSSPTPTYPTLIEMLRSRSLSTPDHCIFDFVSERVPRELTYRELDESARAVASWLTSRSAFGQPVFLLYPPGLDFLSAFFGCLYAGAIAVPAYPPNPALPARTVPRLLSIIADAKPSILLTTDQILGAAAVLASEYSELSSLEWQATDTIPLEMALKWQDPEIEPSHLAFLQYTSGSTSSPKGVVLSHTNLLANLEVIHQCFEILPESRGVFWLPLYHDMGLIGGILESIYCGGTATLMSPLEFLKHPVRWLQLLSRTRAHISGAPNFAYNLCVNRVKPEELAELDLSNWSLAFTGAEPIRASTLDRFAEKFGPCGFRRESFLPCYGLAEATLIATGSTRGQLPIVQSFDSAELEAGRGVPLQHGGTGTRRLVGSGKIRTGLSMMILDPESCSPLPDGHVGEIWLRGISIARGYWRRPRETEVTFGAMVSSSREGPFLRTGDLGFVLEGELFVTGRLKDLIIFSGRNIYPQDIEVAADECHAAIKEGSSAAFVMEADDVDRLIVAVEIKKSTGGLEAQRAPASSEASIASLASEVKKAVRVAVTESIGIKVDEVLVLAPGEAPKTSSGKIQRYLVRSGYLEGTLKNWGQEAA